MGRTLSMNEVQCVADVSGANDPRWLAYVMRNDADQASVAVLSMMPVTVIINAVASRALA
jgi:hypothetical protein